MLSSTSVKLHKKHYQEELEELKEKIFNDLDSALKYREYGSDIFTLNSTYSPENYMYRQFIEEWATKEESRYLKFTPLPPTTHYVLKFQIL